MKRTLLCLNVIIGLAAFWLIFQFNQIAPGGRYYQEINRLDSIKWNVAFGRDEVDKILDLHAGCLSIHKDCEQLESRISRFLIDGIEPRFKALEAEPLLAEYQHRIAPISAAYWENAKEMSIFVTTQNNVSPVYVLRAAELRSNDLRLINQFLTVLEDAGYDHRKAVLRHVRATQLTFVLMVLALWTFSAVITDMFVIAPGRRSADPTRKRLGDTIRASVNSERRSLRSPPRT